MVVLAVTAHHELWRDELQVWLQARAAGNPVELIELRRYEPHPALWDLLVWPLTRLTDAPVAMSLLHVAIATATAPAWMDASAIPRGGEPGAPPCRSSDGREGTSYSTCVAAQATTTSASATASAYSASVTGSAALG